MDHNDKKRFEPVYTAKVRAGKRRTYFFEIRETTGGEYFITITESLRKFDGKGFEKHKIFLYKEDFNRYLKAFKETINYVKTELMPTYDFDEYTRREEEWEKTHLEKKKKKQEQTKKDEPQTIDELKEIEKRSAPIKLYFNLSEYSENEIASGISFLSDLYRSIGGDKLVIDNIEIFETQHILEPQFI